MLRSILLAAILFCSVLSFSGHSVAAPTQDEDEQIMPSNDDRWVPWPWSLAQPFPWGDIQGLWKVEHGDFTSYFSLKIVRLKSTGVRQLQVKQYDGDTCRMIASGVGIERSEKVFAQMTSKLGKIYRVQLTAFQEKDAPEPPLRIGMPLDAVMVLSMGTLDVRGPEDMVHMQIAKISHFVTQRQCFEDVKKAEF